MSKETQENEKNSGGEWKGLVQNFASSMLAKAGDDVSQKIKLWISRATKHSLGLFAFMAGIIFVLLGVSSYFNSVWADQSPWIGYGVAGLCAFFGGYMMRKEH